MRSLERQRITAATYVVPHTIHCSLSHLRFGFRGLMLDLARHFLSADSIKRQIDLMARYKLNFLHLHFSDDESWALQIDGIPELTEVGICHIEANDNGICTYFYN